jgi:hypothetical protein
MTRIVRPPLVWLVAAVITGAAVLLITSSGDEGGPPSPRSPRPPATHPPRARHHGEAARAAPRTAAGRTREQVHRAVAESPRARLDAAERDVVRVVRAYVTALDTRDGARACDRFAPGALDSVRFPRERGTCARSVSASIGYRDPHGFPVFRHSRIARVVDVAVEGGSARVTATTVTRFAGDREPSVEDDLIYLALEGGRWLVVKPDALLYRAIGAGNIPPSVLTPP